MGVRAKSYRVHRTRMEQSGSTLAKEVAELSGRFNSEGEWTLSCISHKHQCGQQQRVGLELLHHSRQPQGTLNELSTCHHHHSGDQPKD